MFGLRRVVRRRRFFLQNALSAMLPPSRCPRCTRLPTVSPPLQADDDDDIRPLSSSAGPDGERQFPVEVHVELARINPAPRSIESEPEAFY